MEPLEIAVIGVSLVAFTLVSRRIISTPVTMPIVFVALGAAMSALGLVEVSAELGAVGLLAEVTLAVILFSDATRISLRRLRHEIGLPVRLLGIGLPLTVAAGALVLALIFPDWAIAEAVLVAAVLAPTDAALGSAVVEDESVPARDRLALNVESGLNDGMVVPVVTVATSVVLATSRTASAWVGFVVQQIGYGTLIGIAVGTAGISLLGGARRFGWSDPRYEQIATFALPVVALCGADAVGGNGFIAAFVGGLWFARGGWSRRSRSETDHVVNPEFLGEFTEDAAQLLAVLAFFVFGNLFVGDAIGSFGPRVILSAVAILTVVRMLPVAVCLTGAGLRWQPKVFIGWFGPRGLASIVFGILLLEEFEAAGQAADELFGIVTVTVTLSVLLHGATASIGARTYGAWAARDLATADDPDHLHAMNRAADASMPRSRWSLRR